MFNNPRLLRDKAPLFRNKRRLLCASHPNDVLHAGISINTYIKDAWEEKVDKAVAV